MRLQFLRIFSSILYCMQLKFYAFVKQCRRTVAQMWIHNTVQNYMASLGRWLFVLCLQFVAYSTSYVMTHDSHVRRPTASFRKKNAGWRLCPNFLIQVIHIVMQYVTFIMCICGIFATVTVLHSLGALM